MSIKDIIDPVIDLKERIVEMGSSVRVICNNKQLHRIQNRLGPGYRFWAIEKLDDRGLQTVCIEPYIEPNSMTGSPSQWAIDRGEKRTFRLERL